MVVAASMIRARKTRDSGAAAEESRQLRHIPATIIIDGSGGSDNRRPRRFTPSASRDSGCSRFLYGW